MPKLGQENIVELRLPSSTEDDPATVKINLNVNGGQAEDIYDSDNKTAATFELVASLIKSWNFEDESGNPAPITAENVRKLSAQDFKYLSEQLFDLLNLEVAAPAVPLNEKKG